MLAVAHGYQKPRESVRRPIARRIAFLRLVYLNSPRVAGSKDRQDLSPNKLSDT